ncbi:hypothetical protein DFH09DRAFT_1109318 [Mycena vulgaris]|nr:hypothetical protein DFH09DRAFT_1109318 [Mycena vulgaris]
MSGSGATYYNEELKELLWLLKHLPDTIPLGDGHSFIGYVPDLEKVVDTGLLMHLAHLMRAINHQWHRYQMTPSTSNATVDITIPFFRDEPVPGADEIRSLLTWVGTSGKTASRAKPAARLIFGGEVEGLDF